MNKFTTVKYMQANSVCTVVTYLLEEETQIADKPASTHGLASIGITIKFKKIFFNDASIAYL